MRKFGLIGKTLKHSFSQKYFTAKFKSENIPDCQYDLYELETIDEFSKLLEIPDLAGLNVTLPYKQSVIPFLDEIDPIAAEINAVNTIKISNNRLTGYNTDIIGFEENLKKFIGRKKVEKALVLGTGGASQAIQFSLKRLGMDITIVSRSAGDIQYDSLSGEVIRNHRLIVNCTPLGTYPDIDQCPDIPYRFLNRKHLLYDLVYNPEKTLFLTLGEAEGASVMNGYPMLVGQAEASWRIWNGI